MFNNYLRASILAGREGGPQYFAKGAMHQSGPSKIKLQHVLPCQSVIKIIKIMKCLIYRLSGKLLESLPLDVRFFGVKIYKIRFRLGLRPRPHLGSLQCPFAGRTYSAPLTLWLHLRGPTSTGRGRGREGG